MLLSDFVIDYTQCCALQFAHVCCLIQFQDATLQHCAEDLQVDVAELPFHVFHEICLAAIHRNMLCKPAVSAQCRW